MELPGRFGAPRDAERITADDARAAGLWTPKSKRLAKNYSPGYRIGKTIVLRPTTTSLLRAVGASCVEVASSAASGVASLRPSRFMTKRLTVAAAVIASTAVLVGGGITLAKTNNTPEGIDPTTPALIHNPFGGSPTAPFTFNPPGKGSQPVDGRDEDAIRRQAEVARQEARAALARQKAHRQELREAAAKRAAHRKHVRHLRHLRELRAKRLRPVAHSGRLVHWAWNQVGKRCGSFNFCNAWCAVFASKGWNAAGGKMPVYPLVRDIYRWAVRNHRWRSGSGAFHKPGDLVLYKDGPGVMGFSHVGIVVNGKGRGGSIRNIEGNYSDQVYVVGAEKTSDPGNWEPGYYIGGYVSSRK